MTKGNHTILPKLFLIWHLIESLLLQTNKHIRGSLLDQQSWPVTHSNLYIGGIHLHQAYKTRYKEGTCRGENTRLEKDVPAGGHSNIHWEVGWKPSTDSRYQEIDQTTYNYDWHENMNLVRDLYFQQKGVEFIFRLKIPK